MTERRSRRSAPVIDGHSDVPLDVVRRREAGEREVLYRRHLPAWRAGGVDGAILTVVGDEIEGEDSLSDYALRAIRHVADDIAERPEDLALVRSAEEMRSQISRGRFAIALNVEGGRSLEGDIDNLHRFYEAGIRFLTLTWNAPNALGMGAACEPDSDSGLTSFGRRVVLAMAELGMVTDLSHASPVTFWDAVALETGNLIASHSNAAALKPHSRNISDDQIRAIANQDGYVGVCFYPGFLHSDDPTVGHVVDHIIHIAGIAGIDHVAIGPDYIDYALEEIVAHIRASGVSYGDNFVYPRGIETVASLGNLTEEMLRRGLSDDDIGKVLGGNLLRVFERVARSASA